VTPPAARPSCAAHCSTEPNRRRPARVPRDDANPAAEDTGDAEDSGGEDEAGRTGSTRLRLAADPGGDLAFDRDSLRAKPGRVVIAFTNPSQVPHAVEVEGNGVEEETETVTGGSARLTLDLEAGEYTFYCPVGNHEQAGMSGTLTVR
jgi:plastocyanin